MADPAQIAWTSGSGRWYASSAPATPPREIASSGELRGCHGTRMRDTRELFQDKTDQRVWNSYLLSSDIETIRIELAPGNWRCSASTAESLISSLADSALYSLKSLNASLAVERDIRPGAAPTDDNDDDLFAFDLDDETESSALDTQAPARLVSDDDAVTLPEIVDIRWPSIPSAEMLTELAICIRTLPKVTAVRLSFTDQEPREIAWEDTDPATVALHELFEAISGHAATLNDLTLIGVMPTELDPLSRRIMRCLAQCEQLDTLNIRRTHLHRDTAKALLSTIALPAGQRERKPVALGLDYLSGEYPGDLVLLLWAALMKKQRLGMLTTVQVPTWTEFAFLYGYSTQGLHRVQRTKQLSPEEQQTLEDWISEFSISRSRR